MDSGYAIITREWITKLDEGADTTSESRTGKVYRWHRPTTKLTRQPTEPEATVPGAAAQPVESASRTETLPRRWFCAYLSPSGEISRLETESVAGILDVVKKSTLAWIDFWSDDFERDATRVASELGFSSRLVSSLFGDYSVTYLDYDTELGMRLPSIQVVQFDVRPNPLLLLLRKNFVFTIHPPSEDRRFSRLRRYSDTVLKKIPQNIPPEDRLTLLLARIIDENNDRNFDELRKIEEHGDELSKSLADPRAPRDKLGVEIYQMKHALITYLDALWETLDVTHNLRYGDAELITNSPDLLNKIGLLAEDVNRQIGLAEHTSEVLASGLEVLQGIYNNQLQMLSNRMSLIFTHLTIIGTAILVPNTLATILSNTAFDLGPEDTGWYVALLVISTIVSTALVYWWVRKKGWLPGKMD